MLHYPGFNKIALEIGPFFGFGPLQVHWYGVMYLAGFAAAWWLGRHRAAQPRSTWTAVDVDDFLFFAMLGVIFGGRIGYVLLYGLQFWAQDPWYPLKITQGGMSFHGGLVGVLIGIALFAKRRGRRIADVFDFAAPLPGIGLLAGRLGNFINGELWGRPTDVPWGFMVNGEGRHATQLYEAALEGVVLFAVLWWFTAKPRVRLAPSGLFLLLYGCARVTVEFWRLPDEQIGYLYGGWLTMGHLLSLPMVVAGIITLAVASRRGEPSGNFSAPA
jgi:phosphatidylglycerol:prolipoprotein diacylglycerol transferase